MVAISLADFRRSADSRHAAFVGDALSVGKAEGDQLVFEDTVYANLLHRHPPKLGSEAAALLQSGGSWIAAGLLVVDGGTHQARSGQCAVCPSWDARRARCLECGCFGLKLWLTSSRCTLGKW